jgi:phosphatidate cytidylyltransferase
MKLDQLTNLQQRVVSALVLAAVVLALTAIGGLAFRLLATAIAAAMFFEWVSITPGGLRAGRLAIAAFFGAAVGFVLFAADPLPAIAAGLALGAAAALVAETGRQGAWVAKGFAYAFLTGFVLVELRDDTGPGLVAILFLFAVVWATDISAYFVGRAIGGPKLAPAVSPGKTWSGAIGGMAGGVLAGTALAVATGTASAAIVAAAIVLSFVSQLGDLFESGIKRQAGVKDSSRLIPGHGGVMDRVDGLAVAAMALYLMGVAGGGLDQPARNLF